MKKFILCGLVMALSMVAVASAESPRVALETTKGTIVLELYQDKAPTTVRSFLENVRTGYYDGTIFHRVIKDFMVQGGGFTAGGQLKPTEKELMNEANNGLKNVRGTVAMARKGSPHSASTQFFINDTDNSFLDHTTETPRGWGYCVFGKVVEGMDVVDKITAVSVRRSQLSEAQPLETISIIKARVVEPAAAGSD